MNVQSYRQFSIFATENCDITANAFFGSRLGDDMIQLRAVLPRYDSKAWRVASSREVSIYSWKSFSISSKKACILWQHTDWAAKIVCVSIIHSERRVFHSLFSFVLVWSASVEAAVRMSA